MVHRRHREMAASLLALLVLAIVISSALAATFSATTSNSGDTFAAASDFRAPTVSSTVIGKAEGGTPGFIHAGGTYRCYASAADSGKPASGIATVSGELSALSTGAGATALSLGVFSVGGQSFNYRSGALTAKSTLSAGTYTYSLIGSDLAGNAATQTGFTVVVDNTSPTGTDVQATNKAGGTAGRPELGDTITFTFSEPIDPNSILAGWSGAAQNVVVRIENNTGKSGGNDVLSIRSATDGTALALGSVDLGRKDYVTATTTFGTTGTPSTMTQSANSIAVTLGTAAGSPTTAAGTGTMLWSPSNGAYDRAGNAASTSAVTESGSGDREF